MTWFEALTGVREQSPAQVRESLFLRGNRLESSANGRSWVCGELETPTLADLRARAQALCTSAAETTVRELVADVQRLHQDPASAGALFQVASQFNLLEMVSDGVPPERGVGIYENDPTQGPACAIAAGAGTIYRNYFAPVNGQIGQTHDNQIDCLADMETLLSNGNRRLWRTRNGYVLPSEAALQTIAARLKDCGEQERDRLRGALRIGIQWHTQVTLGDAKHLVSQAYCSALPVAYSNHPPHLWTDFARLVLEAAYEATFCAALLNAEQTGNRRVYLTLLGGGAFGNDTEWIMGAIRRTLRLHRASGLDVAIVSYGSSKPCVRSLLNEFQQR